MGRRVTASDSSERTADLVADLFSSPDFRTSTLRPDQPPVGLVDVAGVLTDGRARFPHVALTLDGAPVPARAFCTERSVNGTPVAGLVDPAKVEGLITRGASVVLNEMETYWPSLGSICASVGSLTRASVGVKAFLSPPGRGAYPLHQDAVHVVVLQCAGAKEWVVFDRFGDHEEAGPVEPPEGVDATHHVTLAPGDVLSVPPGLPHRATTVAGWSLHLSFIVKPPDAVGQVKREIQSALDELPAGRTAAQLREGIIATLIRRQEQPADDVGIDDRHRMRVRLAEIMAAGRG